MARVVIRVEREGGSTIEISEQSLFPLHTDEQVGRLTREAFLRSLMALGVSLAQPDPEPTPPATAARPEQVLTPTQMQRVAEMDDERKAA